MAAIERCIHRIKGCALSAFADLPPGPVCHRGPAEVNGPFPPNWPPGGFLDPHPDIANTCDSPSPFFLSLSPPSPPPRSAQCPAPSAQCPVAVSVSSAAGAYITGSYRSPARCGSRVPTTGDQDQGPLRPASVLPPAMPASPLALGLLPRVLQTLLLLATSLSVQHGGASPLHQGAECRTLAPPDPPRGGGATDPASFNTVWDSPNCTKGVVLVSQGKRAVMTCNISNDFSAVTVCKRVRGNACQKIFRVKAPGNFTRDGWHLQVQGRVAELVTEEANPTQAGEYRWLLKGRQWNWKATKLNVTDHHPGAEDALKGEDLILSTGAPETSLTSLPDIRVSTAVGLGLALGMAGLIVCHRCRGPQKHM
ncbi:secreted and transmembrane protein 1 [Trichechus inunguis]